MGFDMSGGGCGVSHEWGVWGFTLVGGLTRVGVWGLT